MKKLLIAIAMMGFGVAYAGDFHVGEELECQQCHTMHSSRQHGFALNSTTWAVDTSGNGWGSQDATKQLLSDKLLIGGDPTKTCLTCHNGSYDVWGQGQTGTRGNLDKTRSGGALNEQTAGTYSGTFPLGTNTNGSLTVQYANSMGHSMGFSGTAPGMTTNPFSTTNFTCGDCHEIHGNSAFRNLGPLAATRFDASSRPTYTFGATADAAYDVTETKAATYTTVGVKFGSGNDNFRMNAYCAACHGDFHGATNVDGATAGHFKRHPTSTVSFAANDTRYVASNAIRPVVKVDGTLSPGCLTCHKAHGNARTFALIIPTAGGVAQTDLENGDEAGALDYTGTRYFWNPRTLCNTCHEQGRE